MKWHEFLSLDILLLPLSYALMRSTVSYSDSNASFISINIFDWQMKELAWLHVIVGSLSYLIITLL